MKRLSVYVALLIAVGVTGCAGLRAQEAIRQAAVEAERINQACRAQKLQGTLATWVDAVQCGNDRMRQVMQASGYPHMDLINLLLASRMMLAERMDAGQLTEAQANVMLAELGTRITTEEQARNLAAHQAYSQRLMGVGAAMQGFGTLNQSLQPPSPIVVVPTR